MYLGSGRCRFCRLRCGRLRPGQPSGSFPPGLRPVHQRPAGADQGRLPGLSPGAGGGKAWNRHRRYPGGKGGDHHLPHRRGLPGQPSPGLGEVRPGHRGRPVPPGFYRQRHGLFSHPGLCRPLRGTGGFAKSHSPGGGQSGNPVPGGCLADSPGGAVFGQIRPDPGGKHLKRHGFGVSSSGQPGQGAGF